MESKIKWKKGIPKEIDNYIITTNDGVVRCFRFHPKKVTDVEFFQCFVLAWCKLSDIAPYKGGGEKLAEVSYTPPQDNL